MIKSLRIMFLALTLILGLGTMAAAASLNFEVSAGCDPVIQEEAPQYQIGVILKPNGRPGSQLVVRAPIEQFWKNHDRAAVKARILRNLNIREDMVSGGLKWSDRYYILHLKPEVTIELPVMVCKTNNGQRFNEGWLFTVAVINHQLVIGGDTIQFLCPDEEWVREKVIRILGLKAQKIDLKLVKGMARGFSLPERFVLTAK
jgi:hypothetical protein